MLGWRRMNTAAPKKIKLLILLGCLVFSVATGATAEPGNITPTQREKLKSVAFNMRQKTQRIRDELIKARIELLRAYQSWDLDERKVKDTISRISKAQLALLNLHLENQFELRCILSASQFDELARQVVRQGGRGPRGFHHPHEEGPWDMPPDRMVLEAAGVSAEQARKILRLYDSPRKRELIERLRRYTGQLISLYSKFDLDRATARSLVEKIHDCQLELLNLSRERQEALRSILTRDQFEKMRDEIARRFPMPKPWRRPPRPGDRG